MIGPLPCPPRTMGELAERVTGEAMRWRGGQHDPPRVRTSGRVSGLAGLAQRMDAVAASVEGGEAAAVRFAARSLWAAAGELREPGGSVLEVPEPEARAVAYRWTAGELGEFDQGDELADLLAKAIRWLRMAATLADPEARAAGRAERERHERQRANAWLAAVDG